MTGNIEGFISEVKNHFKVRHRVDIDDSFVNVINNDKSPIKRTEIKTSYGSNILFDNGSNVLYGQIHCYYADITGNNIFNGRYLQYYLFEFILPLLIKHKIQTFSLGLECFLIKDDEIFQVIGKNGELKFIPFDLKYIINKKCSVTK